MPLTIIHPTNSSPFLLLFYSFLLLSCSLPLPFLLPSTSRPPPFLLLPCSQAKIKEELPGLPEQLDYSYTEPEYPFHVREFHQPSSDWAGLGQSNLASQGEAQQTRDTWKPSCLM